jgi:DDE family transposase
MWKSIAGWASNQVRLERERMNDRGALPFCELLPASRVEQALNEENVNVCERGTYTPLVTLWTFLSQVLSPDHSCREAVARLRAFHTADGQTPCSPETGPYCKARQRLPEIVCARLVRDSGRELHDQVKDSCVLNGRPVKLVDGSTVSMPDTPANQAEYPQPRSQKPGLGFPLARIVALLSLASGAALDLAISRYTGKETGETALFRQLWRSLFAGDVVVGDRYFASFWDLALLKMAGVDSVFRQHQLRLTREQRIKQLGHGDYLLRIPKPQCPSWLDEESYRRIPDELIVREVTRPVKVRGSRVKELTLVTTLCDGEQTPAAELGEVYRMRWHAEIDLRSIKVTMQMDILRCKKPEMVRKEIWMHLLAYNLLRGVMAEAATENELNPREVSFKGALQTLSAYRPLVERASAARLPDLYQDLLIAIASHRVGDRPNRYEPRAIKRRPKPHALLTVPRRQAKRLLAAGVID